MKLALNPGKDYVTIHDLPKLVWNTWCNLTIAFRQEVRNREAIRDSIASTLAQKGGDL